MASVLASSNPAFTQYALSCGILALKMLAMVPLIVRHRITKKVFVNPEDAASMQTKIKTDEDVERGRRAHLNDLENIPLFWVVGLLFLFTDPCSLTTKICYYGFAASRIGHTISYVNGLWPHRGICFIVGLAINVFMTVSVIYNFIV